MGITYGARGGTWTRTPSLAPDFESGASTNSATLAMNISLHLKKQYNVDALNTAKTYYKIFFIIESVDLPRSDM